jgi:hypothetical protein
VLIKYVPRDIIYLYKCNLGHQHNKQACKSSNHMNVRVELRYYWFSYNCKLREKIVYKMCPRSRLTLHFSSWANWIIFWPFRSNFGLPNQFAATALSFIFHRLCLFLSLFLWLMLKDSKKCCHWYLIAKSVQDK